MAIAVDATSASSGTAGTTVTWSHTCTGSDLVLVVLAGGTTLLDVSDVTYNGVAMTEVASVGTQRDEKIYVLEDPATGAHDIVVTKTSGEECDAGAISFTGASTSAATNTDNGFGTSQSLTVNTTNTGNGYVVSGVIINDPGSITYGGSGTEWSNTTAGNLGASFVYHSYSSGGNVSESWTSANNRAWATAGVEITELVASTFVPKAVMF